MYTSFRGDPSQREKVNVKVSSFVATTTGMARCAVPKHKVCIAVTTSPAAGLPASQDPENQKCKEPRTSFLASFVAGRRGLSDGEETEGDDTLVQCVECVSARA
jgi:hypothetical protein